MHETAAALVDRPRVVYVDNDPVVTWRNRALLAGGRDGVAVVHEDIRCPGQVFARDGLWKTIDFGRPAGVLFVAVLHFIPGEDDPLDCVGAFCSLMAPGSFLAVSHVTSDGTGPAVMAAVRNAYRRPGRRRCSGAGRRSRGSSPAWTWSGRGSSSYPRGAPARAGSQPGGRRSGSWAGWGGSGGPGPAGSRHDHQPGYPEESRPHD